MQYQCNTVPMACTDVAERKSCVVSATYYAPLADLLSLSYVLQRFTESSVCQGDTLVVMEPPQNRCDLDYCRTTSSIACRTALGVSTLMKRDTFGTEQRLQQDYIGVS